MKDYMNFKGHFKIESIDKRGKILDAWEDDNLIMDAARTSVAKMFSNLNTTPEPFINKIVLGSRGHQYTTSPYDIQTNITTPKTPLEGVVSSRDRLFSEFVTVTSGVSTIPVLSKGDVVYNNTLDGAAAIGYYEYIGSGATSYAVTAAVLTGGDWFFIHASVPPYYLFSNFTLPGTTAGGGSVAAITSENDSLTSNQTGTTFSVEQSGSSVIFRYIVPTNVGNGQFGTTSSFTEAALYADNSAIFSMKTFPARNKDTSVELRITWTITF